MKGREGGRREPEGLAPVVDTEGAELRILLGNRIRRRRLIEEVTGKVSAE